MRPFAYCSVQVVSRRMGRGSEFWIGMLVLAAALLCFEPALAQTGLLNQGQGFMVKPMRMEGMAPAGQAIDMLLEVRNIEGTRPVVVDLRLVELSQTIDGGWRLIEPGSEDTSALLSSREWATLSADRVVVEPMAPAEITARLNVPASARGVYFAGVVAETPVPENATGITVRVRFLIPVIVNIQGRPVRQQVVLDDAAMTYKAEPGAVPTTTAHLRIENRGRTFSRVRGTLRIERESDGLWRPVTTVNVPERGIIPGVAIELGDDLRRRLPTGDYRLRGEIYVDGRRVAPIEKEIAFVGDPDADIPAYDTTLQLTPGLLDLDVAPGATRTTVVRVENPGDDPVNVAMVAAIPRVLAGVEMGDLKGVDYSAAAWTEIRPAAFTIAPGRWQNVRVVSRVPRNGAIHPHYYADLILNGTYPDGQSAGETRSTVHLANREGETIVDGIVEQLQLAEGDKPAEFIVQVRLANVGNVGVSPQARALVLNPQGRAERSVILSGDEGPLLPLGKRIFSGELSLEGLEPGYYALRAVATLVPGEETTMQHVLLIEAGESDGAPLVTLLDAATAELPGEIYLPADETIEGDAVDAE